MPVNKWKRAAAGEGGKKATPAPAPAPRSRDPDQLLCSVPQGQVTCPGGPLEASSSVTMSCSNPACSLKGVLHERCFEKFEDLACLFLSRQARCRSWSEKQVRSSVWNNRGYDLIYKMAACDCGHGHLRRLEGMPPDQAAAADEPKKKKKEKTSLKPKLNVPKDKISEKTIGNILYVKRSTKKEAPSSESHEQSPAIPGLNPQTSLVESKVVKTEGVSIPSGEGWSTVKRSGKDSKLNNKDEAEENLPRGQQRSSKQGGGIYTVLEEEEDLFLSDEEDNFEEKVPPGPGKQSDMVKSEPVTKVVNTVCKSVVGEKEYKVDEEGDDGGETLKKLIVQLKDMESKLCSESLAKEKALYQVKQLTKSNEVLVKKASEDGLAKEEAENKLKELNESIKDIVRTAYNDKMCQGEMIDNCKNELGDVRRQIITLEELSRANLEHIDTVVEGKRAALKQVVSLTRRNEELEEFKKSEMKEHEHTRELLEKVSHDKYRLEEESKNMVKDLQDLHETIEDLKQSQSNLNSMNKHLEADISEKDGIISSLTSDLQISRQVGSKANELQDHPSQEDDKKSAVPLTAPGESISDTLSEKKLSNPPLTKLRNMLLQDITTEGLTSTQDTQRIKAGDLRLKLVLLSMEVNHLQEVARVRAVNQDVLEEKLEVVTDRLRHQVEENRMFKVKMSELVLQMERLETSMAAKQSSRPNSTSGSSGIQSEEEADMELVVKGDRAGPRPDSASQI